MKQNHLDSVGAIIDYLLSVHDLHPKYLRKKTPSLDDQGISFLEIEGWGTMLQNLIIVIRLNIEHC